MVNTSIEKKDGSVNRTTMLSILFFLPVLSGCVEYAVAEAAIQIATNVVPPVYKATKEYLEKSDSEPIVASSTGTAKPKPRLQYLTDKHLCNLSTRRESHGGTIWDASFRLHVVEAKSRGFTTDTCSRLLGRKIVVASRKPKTFSQSSSLNRPFSNVHSKQICSVATTASGEAWEQNTTFAQFVEEAKQRGLSLRECARLTEKRYQESIQSVREEQTSDHDICMDAVDIRVTNASRKPYQRAYGWSKDSAAVSNAKTRGLSPEACGRLVVTNPRIAKERHEQKLKEAAERERLQGEATQERARKSEAEKRMQLAAYQKRQLADARRKHLALLRNKNRHSFAVIIGNKNYKGRTPKVSYAHNDADGMKRFVLDRLAYREGNVIDLRDATRNEIATMFGNKDTHKGRLFNIIRAGKSDVTVFYSGHGVPGLDNRRPYLLPVDGDPNLAEITGYPVDVLYANLAKLPARSITVYLDACFSGESEKGMLISATSGISVSPKMPRSRSWMTVITAAEGDQFASWDEKAKHGLFTKHLLEALNGKADTEDFGNSDGNVSLAEVRNYLDDEMTYQARFVWNRQQRASVRGQDQTVLASVFKMPEGLSDVSSIEEMDATYVVLKSANLRAGPSTATGIVGKLNANASVNVTGKVIGKNWYRLNDGSFVFGSLLQASN
jgi:uncharacterized protein YraI